MSKKNEFTYEFVDPNTKDDLEKLLKHMIIDKMLSLHTAEKGRDN